MLTTVAATPEGGLVADGPVVRLRRSSASESPNVGSCAAGEMQTVTLRFALAGEATAKVVRDRRARIFVSGRSVPMRVKVRAPAA